MTKHRERFAMTDLEQLVSCSAARLVGAGHVVALDGRAVVSLADPAAVTAIVTHVGATGALPDVIAALLAGRPTGVLVMGDANGQHASAMLVRDGIACGVLGQGPLATLGAWALEFQRRKVVRIASAEPTGAIIDPARAFLQETVLASLAGCDCAGARLLWIVGATHWLAEQLPPKSVQDASFLLLELARRADEQPRILVDLGPLDRVPVPLVRPGPLPGKPEAAAVKASSDDDDGWDFFDDPDPAAMSEWADARHVFDACDGMADVTVVAERTMLGGFRTTQALVALAKRGHVALMAPSNDTDIFDELLAGLDLAV